MKHCRIEDCERMVFSRGLCSAHHHRLVRYGDPLAKPAASRKRMVEIDTEQLRRFCEEHGLTQKDLALRAGVARHTLAQAERRGRINERYMRRLLIAAAWIIEEERERERKRQDLIERAGIA